MKFLKRLCSFLKQSQHILYFIIQSYFQLFQQNFQYYKNVFALLSKHTQSLNNVVTIYMLGFNLNFRVIIYKYMLTLSLICQCHCNDLQSEKYFYSPQIHAIGTQDLYFLPIFLSQHWSHLLSLHKMKILSSLEMCLIY